ncbi:RNaseH domain-containing protein [Actinomadura fibrosa]|uniref:RNaseH domain-containing protein n=1 Tax=Actinomadura fibrosa TaxID=111802 RepID=A0ABW2Y2U2_9ACTN|nr:RNaseH domain-containing protein [Actinomadura fibrosa]
MLITLAYRIPRNLLDEVLGTVTAYPLTEDFEAAWSTLSSEEGQRVPPYSSLTRGIVAATGEPVRMFGESHLAAREVEAGSRRLLLTGRELDHRLRIAVQAWERHIRGEQGPPRLPGVLPEPEAARSYSDFIEPRPGRVPLAPHWVYETAEWQIMRRLAGEPLRIDGDRCLPLRLDTDGALLAWDQGDLIARTHRGLISYGMAKVTARVVTRAGVEDLVLCFDAHLSRISQRWYGRRTKHAWIDRGEADDPVLRLPVFRAPDGNAGDYENRLHPAIATILEACKLKPMTLPPILPAKPGDIRPQFSNAQFHTLGNGLGPRFMLFLHHHVMRLMPMLVPLTYDVDKSIKLPARVEKYQEGGFPSAGVGPSGYRRVTLVCVYATADARARMLEQLAALAGHRVEPRPDGPPVPVNDALDVIARHCPELLSHDTPNRAAYLGDLGAAPSAGDRLTAVWAETEFHPAAEPPVLDAKPHLRRLFGHLGIPVQFLATEPAMLPEGARPRSASEKEHAARAALRDLLRGAGILDDRMPAALTAKHLPNPLTRRTLLAGVHVRRQQNGHGEPVLVLVMTAVDLVPGRLEECRMLAYSERRKAWVRAAEGIADFNAGAIGSAHLGRTREKAARTRAEIESRLCALADGDRSGVPIVIFVAASSMRGIWPGLADASLGDGPMPGDVLRAGSDDIAVVRLHSTVEEVGRPVNRTEGRQVEDPNQPNAPGQAVYRLTESGVPSWLFPGTSVLFRANGGRRGATTTRFELDDGGYDRRELGKPWHSFTAKEIVVVEPGSWKAEKLVTLTARLCEQNISWDDRTALPVPLHLAVTADKDHPDHRASGQAEDDDWA